jgi:hypothetical protein
MPSFTTSLTKLQTVYLTIKEELKAVNGSEPDHDQVVQSMLENEDYLCDIERGVIANMTLRQTENLFIHKMMH